VRVLACGIALDPLAEMWVHELKGSGDLDPLERVCHRYVSGVDDPSIAYAAESLKLLRAEIMRRTERLKALDRAVCPDKRTTRQIAAKRSLKLRRGSRPASRPAGTAPPAMRSRPSAAPLASPRSTSAAAPGRRRAAAVPMSRP
jgi:hypothetical protein